MADQRGIGKLDERLVDGGIIPASLAGELALVHKKMNAILKKTGAILSDEIFETGNAALRKWLNLLWKQGASQEKLTAYLRCGLAHLTYDFIESQYHQIDIEDLVSRTLVSLKNRNLHASFFKPPVTRATAGASAKKPKTPAKKVKAIKKVDLEKKSVSKTKAATKKPTVKQAAAKKPKTAKPAVKKATPKKTTAKKPSTAKKKTTAAKPAAKKTTSKKQAKTSAAKKTAKKPAKAVAKKSTAVKKPAKATAKKPVAKKPSTKKATKPTAKKPAIKKAAPRKKNVAKKAPVRKTGPR